LLVTTVDPVALVAGLVVVEALTELFAGAVVVVVDEVDDEPVVALVPELFASNV